MAIRTYKVTLDSKNTIAPEPVFLRQGDKTGAVVIDATLMDNGSPVSLSGLTPMFKANTADGQAVIADSTGFNIVNASGGEFTYQVPNALSAVPGKITTAYFSFSDSSGSESTFDVAFIIKKAVDITQAQADDYITIIDGTLKSLEEKIDAVAVPETFANLAAIQSKYPNGSNGIMIAADNGHKYIWTNGAWQDAGIYQAQGIPDKSITRDKVADKTLTDKQINDVNLTTIIDSFASIGSAKSWIGVNKVVISGRTMALDNDDGGDNGIMLEVHTDRQIGTDEVIYFNFDYATPDNASLSGNVELYALDNDNKLLTPVLWGGKKVDNLTAVSFSINGGKLAQWGLVRDFKLIYVIHGKGSLTVSDLTVNHSNSRESIGTQMTRIGNKQLTDNAVENRNISGVNTIKLNNSDVALSDAMRWINTDDIITLDENGLFYQKKTPGDTGAKWLVKTDISKVVYLDVRLSSNTNVNFFVMNTDGVILTELFSSNNNNNRLYSASMAPEQFKAWGITGDFYVMIAIHENGKHFSISNLNVSGTQGLQTLSDTVNSIVDNNGLLDDEIVGQSIAKIANANYIDASIVHYSTYNAAVTVDDAILKTVTAYVPIDGMYSFKVGNIDQNNLIVNEQEYSLKMTAGYNVLNMGNFGIEMPVGSYLFMDISQGKQLFIATGDNPQKVGVLIQDEKYQSDKPGYPGMMMYDSEYLLPFAYTVEKRSNKIKIAELSTKTKTLTDDLAELTEVVNGELFLTSENGKKFRLVVDDNGNLSTDSLIPNSVAIFGNSLTMERGGIGMCASDQNHDWYHYVTEYVKSKNANATFNARANVSNWEAATTSTARQTVFDNQIKPTLTTDTDLVILQLVDNVNSEDRLATFAQDAKTLIANIHTVAPKARVYWVAGWFVDQNKLDMIKAACDQNNATLVNIWSLFSDVSNRGTMGMTRTGIDGTNWQVAIEGEALHPGDKGMRLIADAVIGKLGF